MKMNLESNKQFFLYRNTNDEINIYRKTEEGVITRVPIQNLYSIKYTQAGPIAKLVISLNDALANPEGYEKIVDDKKLFTYPHAKDLIVKWFLGRAQTIDDMSEDQYMGGIPTEELWRKYCVDNAKKMESESMARRD